MTVKELHAELEKILIENPSVGTANILVDVEARRYHAHMVLLESLTYDQAMCEAIGKTFVALNPSYKGSTL